MGSALILPNALSGLTAASLQSPADLRPFAIQGGSLESSNTVQHMLKLTIVTSTYSVSLTGS